MAPHSADRHLQWHDLQRTIIADCHIFKLLQVTREAAWGATGNFYLIDAPDWAIIVPLIRDAAGEMHFVLVRQYRHGSSSVTLEFPAGTVDPHEDPAETARRELAEETGFQATAIQQIGRVNPNPAFMTNTCYTFLADGLTDCAATCFDAHEMIDTVRVPVGEIDTHIRSGAMNSATMLQALYWYRAHAAANS